MRGRSTGTHHNNTIRARIIALYDIFLIELGVTKMSGRAEGQDAEIGTFVGIFTFPLGVMTSECNVRKRSRVECLKTGYPDHPFL